MNELSVPKTLSKLTRDEIAEIQTALSNCDLASLEKAYKRSRFADSRLKAHYLRALNEANWDNDQRDLATFVAEKIIPTFSPRIYDEVLRDFKFSGNPSNALRLSILHRLNPTRTKPLLAEALEKGSFSVKIAAIECLSDHADSFDLLVRYSGKRDFASYANKSISRLGTTQSKEFLIQKLENGDYYALKQCNDKSISKLMFQRAEHLLGEIAEEDSKSKRDMLFQELGLLTRVCEDNSAKFDRLLLGCLKSATALKSGSEDIVACTLVDIAGMIGLRKKSIALRIIEVRDAIPPEEFGIAADVGRKHLPPSKFFDVFSPYSNPRAKRSTVEGKRDGELFNSLSRELSKLWRYTDFQAGRKEKAKLDPRWADLAFKQKDDDLILELANLKHPQLANYLTKLLNAHLKKDLFDLFPIIEAMVRSKHADAPEEFVSAIRRKALSKKFDPDYQRWLYLLKDLPKSMPQKVLYLLDDPKCNQEAHEQIPKWLSLPFDEYFGVAAL
ncbi:MAG: hypothetical protein ABL888_10095 [Pirellulaceae bacterium]